MQCDRLGPDHASVIQNRLNSEVQVSMADRQWGSVQRRFHCIILRLAVHTHYRNTIIVCVCV